MNTKINDGAEPELMETDADNVGVPGMELEEPMNGQEYQDQNMDEDESRSEATFSFEVPSFSKMKESTLSPPCIVRNLPWKIMIMPRISQQDRAQKSLGFFLQCNGESESTTWTCDATADLRILSYQPNIEPFSRKISHHFNSKENDWGFSHFMLWGDVLESEKGYIHNDTIILQVHVAADAPHGVSWDSKKHTGFVGLKNQGATCYMNSLLQTLYFTNQLRRAVYKMPTESDDSTKSVALALQRVFHELQFSDKPVGTKKLTKSFGWETMDSFMQHDVQEFLRVLLDKLESKMKGTCVEGTVPKLFEGKMVSFIKCKHVDYESKRTETYYDIQLNIKGKKNIDESFQDYVTKEALEGDNKYDAGEYGLQDAEKGVIFESFPPVLHLHLMRFQYDPITDCSVKFNDKFEFDEKINLDKYLHKPEATPASYTLHAVLVHSGDNHGGHYVVFINPKGDGKWCKFDDDVVSRCRKEAAIECNYGGHGEEESNLTIRSCTNAYMLVYIRDSQLPTVLQEVTPNDIPQELTDRLNEEKKLELFRRKERNEAHLYMQVNVVLEDEMKGHQGNDLFSPEKAHYRQFRVKKRSTLPELMEIFAENLKYNVNQMRPWPMANRTNGARRPACLEIDDQNKLLSDLAENHNPWTVFLEIVDPDSGLQQLPNFDKDGDVLLFFKYYDPRHKKMHYAGHYYAPVSCTVQHLIPILNERAGLPPDTKLQLYEERKASQITLIDRWNEPLEKVFEELMDGDIICFQRDRMDDDLFELPTCKDYFEEYSHRVEVLLCDKAISTEQGFTMELSLRMTYEQMADAVAQRLDTQPNLLQFFKSQTYKDGPGTAFRPRDGTLKELLIYNKSKNIRKVYYQHLSIPLDELENKKQIKCVWVPENLKEEKEFTLFPNKNGCVSDLIDEARKAVELTPNGTGKLRVYDMTPFKSCQIYKETAPLTTVCSPTNATMGVQLRVEEIPHEEIDLADDEILVPVAHYQKELYSAFGVPFFVKVKNGETFTRVKDRIIKKLDVSEKEFDTYKLSIVQVAANRSKVVSDEAGEMIISVAELRKAWIGLDHVNKAPKRSRFNYLEKAIKIYN